MSAQVQCPNCHGYKVNGRRIYLHAKSGTEVSQSIGPSLLISGGVFVVLAVGLGSARGNIDLLITALLLVAVACFVVLEYRRRTAIDQARIADAFLCILCGYRWHHDIRYARTQEPSSSLWATVREGGPSKQIWLWLGLAGILLLLGVTWWYSAQLSRFVVTGASTAYEAFGVSATLPGNSWRENSDSEAPGLETRNMLSGGGELWYSVSRASDRGNITTVNLQALADIHSENLGYTNKATRRAAEWKGMRAVRFEDTFGGHADAYHQIEYLLVYKGIPYYVTAGARNRVWSSGGREYVLAILESVTFR